MLNCATMQRKLTCGACALTLFWELVVAGALQLDKLSLVTMGILTCPRSPSPAHNVRLSANMQKAPLMCTGKLVFCRGNAMMLYTLPITLGKVLSPGVESSCSKTATLPSDLPVAVCVDFTQTLVVIPGLAGLALSAD